MPSRFLARLSAFLLVVIAGVGAFSAPAWAHNSLQSSTPADGAVLTSAPQQLSLVFAKAVPLDTASVDLIDGTGAKVEIGGLSNGPSGETEVIATLPTMASGAYTFRWRLVGSDGHAITGRVAVSIAAAPAAPPPTVAPVPTAAPVAPPAAAVPVVTAAPVAVSQAVPLPEEATIDTTTSVVAVEASAAAAGLAEPWSTPSGLRWLLRVLAYVAMLAIGGTVATVLWVWDQAWHITLLRRAVQQALGIVMAGSVVQLLITASDVAGKPLWSALGGVSGALQTDAGLAALIRLFLAAGIAWCLFAFRPRSELLRWRVAAGFTAAAMATWAFGGHSKSMRWPLLGIPLDIAHFAAAAAWFGGLAILGGFGLAQTEPTERKEVLQRFGQLAAGCVAILVATGVLQSFRLVGAPWRVFAVAHGRLLLIKLLLVAVMLKVANINRGRVAKRFGPQTKAASPRSTDNLRRAMLTELAIGSLIMAVTAAMVVSPPATASNEISPAPTSTTAPEPTATDPTVTTAAAAPALTAPPATTIPAGVSCTIRQPLAAGSSGDDVLCLQRALAAKGVFQQAPNGLFDEPTTAAVRAYQTANSLFVDGLVGRVTAQSLGIWAT
jgi:copper transport protein